MHKISLLMLFAVAALTGMGATNIVGRVTRVLNGNTIWMTDKNNVRHEFGLYRIEDPMPIQRSGNQTMMALKEMIEGKDVRVELDGTNDCGRILGTVYVGTNNVNLAMVRNGYAFHYSCHDSEPAYVEAEKIACMNRVGVWGGLVYTDPYGLRRSKKQTEYIRWMVKSKHPILWVTVVSDKNKKDKWSCVYSQNMKKEGGYFVAGPFDTLISRIKDDVMVKFEVAMSGDRGGFRSETLWFEREDVAKHLFASSEDVSKVEVEPFVLDL